jgi:hypothetical protein
MRKGEDAPGVPDFRIPRLTFAADHLGERLPAFHVAYEVTAASDTTRRIQRAGGGSQPVLVSP